MDLLRLGVGSALVALVGWSASPGRRTVDDLALDGVVGLALMVPVTLVAGLLGLPISPPWICGGEIVVAALLFAMSRGRLPRPPSTVERPPAGRARDPMVMWSRVVLAAAFGACVWKWVRAPLWSWDHYAIWGTKARRIISDGFLDLTFLRLSTAHTSVPDYPIGLPIAWRILSLGLPTVAVFKTAHALFALATLLVVRRTIRSRTGSETAGNVLAALVALTPLFWDTESVGTAEMPLALFAVAGAALLFDALDGSRRLWVPGVVLGFAPWIKAEGVVVCALVLAGPVVVAMGSGSREERGRPRMARSVLGFLVGPAAALALGAALFRWRFLPKGLSFFWGHPMQRAAVRLVHSRLILAAVAKVLLLPEWLGVWIVFASAFGIAVLRRRRDTAWILGVVGLEVSCFVAVYFFTYLDPLEHIASSFFRVCAAVVPLGAIGVGLLVGAEGRSEVPPGPDRGP